MQKDIRSQNYFEILSDELLIHLTSFLDLSSRLNFGLLGLRFYNIAQDDVFWKNYIRQHPLFAFIDDSYAKEANPQRLLKNALDKFKAWLNKEQFSVFPLRLALEALKGNIAKHRNKELEETLYLISLVNGYPIPFNSLSIKNREEALEICAEFNHVSLLELYSNEEENLTRYPYVNTQMIRAAQNGRFEVLRWIFEESYHEALGDLMKMIDSIPPNRYPTVLQYLFDKMSLTEREKLDFAIKKGHLEFLQSYFESKKIEKSNDNLNSLRTVKKFAQQVFMPAVYADQLDIVKWATAHVTIPSKFKINAYKVALQKQLAVRSILFSQLGWGEAVRCHIWALIQSAKRSFQLTIQHFLCFRNQKITLITKPGCRQKGLTNRPTSLSHMDDAYQTLNFLHRRVRSATKKAHDTVKRKQPKQTISFCALF